MNSDNNNNKEIMDRLREVELSLIELKGKNGLQDEKLDKLIDSIDKIEQFFYGTVEDEGIVTKQGKINQKINWLWGILGTGITLAITLVMEIFSNTPDK